jgi:hypothetical protein
MTLGKMSGSTMLPGMSGLISKLEAIQAECLGEPEDESSKKKKKKQSDGFSDMKTQLHGMMHVVRTNLRERTRIQRKHGNNYQAIEKGHRIRDMLRKVEENLPKLQQLQLRGRKKVRQVEENLPKLQQLQLRGWKKVRQVEENLPKLQQVVAAAQGEEEGEASGRKSSETTAAAAQREEEGEGKKVIL